MTKAIQRLGIAMLLICLALYSCSKQDPSSHEQSPKQQEQAAIIKDLSTERSKFQSHIIHQEEDGAAPDLPTDHQFLLIDYPSEVGKLHAYLTSDPKDDKKHPAMIWITGGDCNSIGDVWNPGTFDDDQTASAYRIAGMAMMFPSLRGGNDNPGHREGFLGEVDDVISAYNYLKTIDYVDTNRIYLGGHSTGGTMALLVAESFAGFSGIFSFGPVGDISGYGSHTAWLPFDLKDQNEVEIRSPENWLHNIQTPTWVIEGVHGNLSALNLMRLIADNEKISFIRVKKASHFSVLAPTNELVATKLMALEADSLLRLSEKEVNQNYRRETKKHGLLD